MSRQTLPGRPYPLGATLTHHGANFSIFSRNSTGVDLLLFDRADAESPAEVIRLDPKTNKTFHFWHVYLPDVAAGQIYGFRVHGPFAPELGHRFDPAKVLLDPYAHSVVNSARYSRLKAAAPGANCATALKAAVVDLRHYDWEGDSHPRHSYAKTVIYEMNVGGFTRNPNSGVRPEARGTFAGVIEKIPYLKDLGITAVELMPVQMFDEFEAPHGLRNYWGYSPVAYFAPHAGYSSRKDPDGPIVEFRDMVKALHRAGIEVILDVVFNHTAEGDADGPTLSFRGIDNKVYYMLGEDRATYRNYTGCGNTFNANHSIVGTLILDSLRFWVSEMHVDGFRFDLATALSRDIKGKAMERPPVLWAIESDPILAGSKLIAEPWDSAGLYRLGEFVNVADWYAEWNGRFRDDVRRFVRGDNETVPALAARILGSSDIYTKMELGAHRSVNFITCHDGFTLADLVSYNHKHNEQNRQNNKDGNDYNLSWNCGVEGPTDNEHILALRARQVRNFLTILFFAQGTPMILMGDELGRTQSGNNNAYCQDNALSWLDWSQLAGRHDLHRFVRGVIHLTQSLAVFSEECGLVVGGNGDTPGITWHGVKLDQPDWGAHSHSLAFSLSHDDHSELIHVMLNLYWAPLAFELPSPPAGHSWRRVIDTGRQPPDDFCELDQAERITAPSQTLKARSCLVLVSRKDAL